MEKHGGIPIQLKVDRVKVQSTLDISDLKFIPKY